MRYKIGDKVRIKLYASHHIYIKDGINSLTNKTAEIKEIQNDTFYIMKEITGLWQDIEISCLVESYQEPVPIHTRWEILDL